MSGFVPLDNNWSYFILDEQSVLFQRYSDQEGLKDIHALYHTAMSDDTITDVVMGYNSITYFFNRKKSVYAEVIHSFKSHLRSPVTTNVIQTHHEIYVDYSAQLDIENVIEYSGLSKEEIISLHSEKTYTVALLGFLPGFIYLEGMDEKISCPRLKIPRKQVPVGAVGIANHQTGMYGIKSPGGWNIIGVADYKFQPEPTMDKGIKPGDNIKFIPV